MTPEERCRAERRRLHRKVQDQKAEIRHLKNTIQVLQHAHNKATKAWIVAEDMLPPELQTYTKLMQGRL